MSENKNAPTSGAVRVKTTMSRKSDCIDSSKDTTEILSLQQKRVYYYLLNAEFPKSAADITRALGQCDPRGHIKGLRDKGIPVQGIWCYCKEHGRYKRYFLPNPLRG